MAKNSTKAVLDNFTIKSYIDDLFESNAGNVRLSHFLNEYQKVLDKDDTKEFMIYEEFGHGLANFASGNKSVKKVINEMNTNLATYGKELSVYKLIECAQDPAARCACADAYTHYLESQDEQSKAILADAAGVLEQSGDPVGHQLTIVIASPSSVMEPAQIQTFDSAGKFDEIQRKIEEDKLRQKVEDAKAEINAYAEQVFSAKKAEQEAEREACCFDNVVNNCGICLGESIKNIMNSDAKTNKKLVETLEQYKGALEQGLYEERLYEGFIKNLTPFNYLNSVNKEIKRLEKVAEDNSAAIGITKILEEMYTTNSYYIIPMIEECACRFIKDPSPINCNQLKSALVSFAADPYVRAMLETLDYFDNKPSFLIGDTAMTIKDRAKLIKEHANISNIYSPIQYIKENECVFNAYGQFYVKKGNTLAKLSEEYVPQLSENFIALCQLVNDPHVAINEDSITLVGNDKVANIYESYIEINGNKETKKTLRDLNEMSMKYDYDSNFFIMASCLAENFDNIANINFAKHIALNEDAGTNVDIFNLNGNIFVNAVNEEMLKSTFYHNVNPIQCKNLINNHMGINVSSLFEELVPSQDKLYLKLNETKTEYEASIAKYEATIEKLKKAKEADLSEDSEKKLDAAIEAAQNKVDELKKEYKDWQDDVDKVTNPESKKDKDNEEDQDDESIKDDNTEVEKSNEPIDAEDVDAAKADLSEPLSVKGGNDVNISDDEFDTYLEGGEEVSGNSDELDSTNVNIPHNTLADDDLENEEPNADELNPQIDDESNDDTLNAIDTNVETSDDIIGDKKDEFNDDASMSDDETIDFNDEITPEEQEESPIENEHDAEIQTTNIPEGYKIVNILFDENLKTGDLFRTGNITLMTDMVSSDGKLYTETNTYAFYIDEETHLPVIEAGEIPVALYNAMVSSIQADENFSKADAEGIDDKKGLTAPEEKAFDSDHKDFPDYDEVYYDGDEVNKVSDELEKDDDEGYFDFTDDGKGDIAFSAKDEEPAREYSSEEQDDETVIPDKNKPKTIKASELFKGVEDEPEEEISSEEIVTPTYKVDNTVIDEPADNINFEDDDFKSEDDLDNDDTEDKSIKSADDEENIEESLLEDNVQAQPAQQNVNMNNQQTAQTQQPQQQVQNGQQQTQQTQQPQQSQQSQQQVQNGQQQTQQPQQPQNGQQPQNTSTNESVRVNEKISLNEARAAFIKLKAEYTTANKKSFIVEGTSKPSKKEVSDINEDDKVPVINKLHEYAIKNAGNKVEITDIQSAQNESIKYFGIIDLLKQKEPMAIYELNNKIYYDNYDDFVYDLNESAAIEEDFQLFENENQNYVCSTLIEDGYELIDSLLLERAKIRKPGFSANGDINKSMKMAEILNGTKDRRDFEKKVEKLSSEAGVNNPLIAQSAQQESINVEESNDISESYINKENVEIIYEPMDWVIIKENGMKAQVTNVVNDGDGNLAMLTILASNGITYDADPEEIEPDPMYLANLPGRTINSTLLGVPRLAEFGINPKTRLTDIVNNDDPALEAEYKDFNDKR